MNKIMFRLATFTFLIISLFASGLFAQEIEKVPACSKRIKGRVIGNKMRIKVPRDTKVRKGRDVDYIAFAIGYGPKRLRQWMSGIEGPVSTSGKPFKSWIEESRSYAKKELVLDGFKGGDWKGELKNGNRWRYFGFYGVGSLTYYDVDYVAAAHFDSIIDGACYKDFVAK